MATQSGSDGADSADPSDPGARLLVRVGDFIEPLTRFDRSHLAMAQSRHDLVPVLARQIFRVRFDVQRSEGVGPLPAGVEPVADAAALERGIEARLAAARVALPSRLAAWAADHGGDSLARPSAGDCFTPAVPLGCVVACAVCAGAGRTTCGICAGAKQVACAACEGRGAMACGKCGGRKAFACRTCSGTGVAQVTHERMVWDEAGRKHRRERYEVQAPCKACGQSGQVACDRCAGVGEVACKVCGGRKVVDCARCRGAGTVACAACGGAGQRHVTASVTCAVSEALEVTPRTGDAEVVAVLRGRSGMEALLELAASHRATAEASNDTLTRDTLVETPVTSVVIAVGDVRTLIRGYGPRQEVMDYENLAGLLMAGDMEQLGRALETTTAMPPTAGAELTGALAGVLASEANARIARTRAKDVREGAAQELRGALSDDYVKRAAPAIRTAVARVYWAGMARGPVAVLALPLVFAPMDLMMRRAGEGVRLMVLLAVMAVAFGAAAAAHAWVVRALQRELAPHGAPAVARIVDAQRLTLTWLVAAGAVVVMLALLTAGVTSVLFPPN